MIRIRSFIQGYPRSVRTSQPALSGATGEKSAPRGVSPTRFRLAAPDGSPPAARAARGLKTNVSGSARGSASLGAASGVARPRLVAPLVLPGRQPVASDPQRRLGAVRDAEGLEDVGDVRLDRLLGDAEALRDDLVRQPLAQEDEDVQLSRRELARLVQRAPGGDELERHLRRERRTLAQRGA